MNSTHLWLSALCELEVTGTSTFATELLPFFAALILLPLTFSFVHGIIASFEKVAPHRFLASFPLRSRLRMKTLLL
jgi:hypothetical protein